MYIQAMQGCWLTQAKDVDYKVRKFQKDAYIATASQAAEWREVSESERKRIIEEGKIFDLKDLNYQLVQKADRMFKQLPFMINDANLTSDEALEMQKYFPTWEQCWGMDVFAGFKFLYQDVLVEVVTPHTISPEIDPSAQPMTLNLIEEENAPTVYYRIVEAFDPSGDPVGALGELGGVYDPNTSTKHNKSENNINNTK